MPSVNAGDSSRSIGEGVSSPGGTLRLLLKENWEGTGARGAGGRTSIHVACLVLGCSRRAGNVSGAGLNFVLDVRFSWFDASACVQRRALSNLWRSGWRFASSHVCLSRSRYETRPTRTPVSSAEVGSPNKCVQLVLCAWVQEFVRFIVPAWFVGCPLRIIMKVR